MKNLDDTLLIQVQISESYRVNATSKAKLPA